MECIVIETWPQRLPELTTNVEWTYNELKMTYNEHRMSIRWAYNEHTASIQWAFNEHRVSREHGKMPPHDLANLIKRTTKSWIV